MKWTFRRDDGTNGFHLGGAWNWNVVEPLINAGVLTLEEGGHFRDARLAPLSRWFNTPYHKRARLPCGCSPHGPDDI